MELADEAGAVAAGEVAPVLVAGVAPRAADKAVAREVKVERAAVAEAVDVAKAKAVTAKVDAEMAEASSSRT
ncbi:MAG TPA: hypothetical protein VN927_06370 [Gemmatimonadaceae bacterium]|nr:hypothetical protein [Gemmatimonadaceae bacterium]